MRHWKRRARQRKLCEIEALRHKISAASEQQITRSSVDAGIGGVRIGVQEELARSGIQRCHVNTSDLGSFTLREVNEMAAIGAELRSGVADLAVGCVHRPETDGRSPRGWDAVDLGPPGRLEQNDTLAIPGT